MTLLDATNARDVWARSDEQNQASPMAAMLSMGKAKRLRICQSPIGCRRTRRERGPPAPCLVWAKPNRKPRDAKGARGVRPARPRPLGCERRLKS